MKVNATKKKFLALVLTISAAFYVAGCGDNVETVLIEEQSEALADDISEDDALKDSASEEAEQETVDGESSGASNRNEDEKDGDNRNEEAVKISAISNMPDKLSDDLYDFQISIDGMIYQFPMWYSDFEALGWEYEGDNTEELSGGQYADMQRWRKDGCAVYTILANMSINTAAYSDSMVAGISLNKCDFSDCDWKIILPDGIQWGISNADDIKAAYGEPSSDYNGTKYYDMTYRYDYYREIKLCVYKETDALAEVKIENIVELEDKES